MGQTESYESFPEALESIQHSIVRQAKSLSDISSLTYEEFLNNLSELNSLCEKCMNSEGKQLVCVVSKGTDSSILWKATVRIACLRVDARTKKTENCRLITLGQFLRIFKTIKNEIATARQIDAQEETHSRLEKNIVDKVSEAVANDSSSEAFIECCICLERKPEVTLPCTHSYCQTCINQWNVENNTCPVCREVMTSRDEEWLLSDAPNSAEITEHIATSLMDIAAE